MGYSIVLEQYDRGNSIMFELSALTPMKKNIKKRSAGL